MGASESVADGTAADEPEKADELPDQTQCERGVGAMMAGGSGPAGGSDPSHEPRTPVLRWMSEEQLLMSLGLRNTGPTPAVAEPKVGGSVLEAGSDGNSEHNGSEAE